MDWRVAERRYPTSKVRSDSQEEISHVQGKEQWLHFAGAAAKEMGIPDHLTCLLKNLYAGQEATVRTGHGTTDWFQIGKYVKAEYCHPAYLTYMQSTS